MPWLAAPSPLRAPVGIDRQIEDLSVRIGRDPSDASLYLRRGELKRIGRDWAGARADCEAARRLDPAMAAPDLCLGRLFLDEGRPDPARDALDRFLAARPEHAGGLVWRARALTRLGEGLAAAADFTRALGLLRPPSAPLPEHYIERARALAAEGDAFLEEAIRGLDEGLARLGQPVTLQLLAIDLELRRRGFDAALARVDRIAAGSPRKEVWLRLRAEILQLAGRPAGPPAGSGDAR